MSTVAELPSRAAQVITPELVSAFQRDGAVCARQLLSPHEVALIREGIDANIAHPSPRAKVASQAGDPGFFIEDFCNWGEINAYRQAIFNSPLGEAAALLMQSSEARLYHDHMLTKEPGTRSSRTPLL
jgi:ectoine hydroxylase-related dioxygenase (phytanoyl-CoA dioxygenase family)